MNNPSNSMQQMSDRADPYQAGEFDAVFRAKMGYEGLIVRPAAWSLICVKCALIMIFSCSLTATSGEFGVSGANAISDNPFIVYGINPSTQVVTGYLAALRTSPGRTDECKFAFAGNLKNLNNFSVKYLSEIDGFEYGGTMSSAVISRADANIIIKIRKDQLGGDCEWILPFINEPRVAEDAGQVAISFGSVRPGDWTGVFAIKSVRVPFYRSPDESGINKAYLVQGDLIYVYDERPGWYYVKYAARKKTTVGWIKKSDTVQIKVGGLGGF